MIAARFTPWRFWFSDASSLLTPSTWNVAPRVPVPLKLIEEPEEAEGLFWPKDSALEKIGLGRRIGVDGLVLFSYRDVTVPSEHAPAGDYLERIGKGAFEAKAGGR